MHGLRTVPPLTHPPSAKSYTQIPWLYSGPKRYGSLLTRFEHTGLLYMGHFGVGNQHNLTPNYGHTEVVHSCCMTQLVK
uniref:Uncharacterized protein n=1 Tax=Lepeophtheirus salmonis TaxID=72036 RepID=A0A0K2T5X6_LEPSM